MQTKTEAGDQAIAGERVDRPIFLVGMPRSGTTVMFEAFARHPDVGWFSYRQELFPAWPAFSLLTRIPARFEWARKHVNPSDQRISRLEFLRDGPGEVYGIWERHCGEAFRNDWLIDAQATPGTRDGLRRFTRSVLRWQGRSRFAAKLTGPPRLSYLSTIFPDLIAIHVVRDGRAVIRSLLRVPFWRDTARLTEPAWRNGLTPDDLRDWESCGRTPEALAAVQWRRCVAQARLEAHATGCPFLEVRYEDFMRDPATVLESLFAHARLAPASPPASLLQELARSANRQRSDAAVPPLEAAVEALMHEELGRYGYLGGDS